MIQRSRQGAITVITATAALNGETAEHLVKAIDACLEEGPPRLVLDLMDVPLIDSVGLETLLDVQEKLENRAGRLKLSGPNTLCQDILNVTGVGNQFEIFLDVKAAMGSFVQ